MNGFTALGIGYKAHQPLVYFAESKVTGLIKIGTTKKIAQRMECLGKVRLLAAMPGDYSVEKKLHLLLKKHNVHGEWFEPSIEVVDAVKAAISGAFITGARH